MSKSPLPLIGFFVDCNSQRYGGGSGIFSWKDGHEKGQRKNNGKKGRKRRYTCIMHQFMSSRLQINFVYIYIFTYIHILYIDIYNYILTYVYIISIEPLENLQNNSFFNSSFDFQAQEYIYHIYIIIYVCGCVTCYVAIIAIYKKHYTYKKHTKKR